MDLPKTINISIHNNLNLGLRGNLDNLTINIDSSKKKPYIYFDLENPVNKSTTINGNFYINLYSTGGKLIYIFNNDKVRVDLNTQFGWKGKGKWGFPDGIYGNLGKKYPKFKKLYPKFVF